MRSDTALDYAVFQLSPKRSRCELYVSGDGKTERLASGLLKPFVTHLTVVEEQVAQEIPSIKLEVKRRKNEGTWFTKGTLERFVRFVSTPDVLELVIKLEAEMSQLEAARKIYLQGTGNQSSSATGGDGLGASTSADITKQELLKAIDVRLVAVKQDLTTACGRASAAGFTSDTVSELQLFAHRFGSHRLSEACTKFILLTQKRDELVNPWKVRGEEQAIRSSFDSDMSIDDPSEETMLTESNGSHRFHPQTDHQYQYHQQTEQETGQDQHASQHQPSMREHANSSVIPPQQHSLRDSSSKKNEETGSGGPIEKKDEETPLESAPINRAARRLSVQDRINMFENKQKEQSTDSGGKVVVGKTVELRRLSSDVSSAGKAAERAVLRRWSGASDMSMDLSGEKKDTESSASTPGSTSNSVNQTSICPAASVSKDKTVLSDTATSSMSKFGYLSSSGSDSRLQDHSVSQTNREECSGKGVTIGLRNQSDSDMQSNAFSGRSEGISSNDRTNSGIDLRASFSEGVGSKHQPDSQLKLKVSSIRSEDGQWKSEVPPESYIQQKTTMGRAKDPNLIDEETSRYRSFQRTSSDVTGSAIIKDHLSSLTNFRSHMSQPKSVESNDRANSEIHSKASFSVVDDVGLDPDIRVDESSQVPFVAFASRTESARSRHQPANIAQLRAPPSTIVDGGVNTKERPVPKRQSRDLTKTSVNDSQTTNQAAYQVQAALEDDALPTQSHWNSFPGKSERTAKKDTVFTKTQPGSLPVRVENSSRQEIKLQRQSSASEQSINFSGRKAEIPSSQVNGEDPFVSHENFTSPKDMSDFVSPAAVEQLQSKTRSSKGNQELNEELQNKANDLEKLFAAHKLRVPGDQSATVRRSKPAEVQVDQVTNTVHKKPVEVTPLQSRKKGSQREPLGSSSDVSVYDPDQGKIAEVCYSENSRGKLYDMYVQKRDAKLKEEWSSNRGQKEAKMKAMQDYLESSSAEMNVKLGSADRQDSVQNARRRAEKLRSFNIRSAMKVKEQSSVGYFQSEEEEDLPDISERFFGETLPGDGSSRGALSKKLLANRTTFSSTPRTSAALLSRSSAKPSYPSSERRRTQPENPLAQSVPNFSDLRKENTKPLSGISKVTTRSHARGARNKSTSDELTLVKEERPRRSQSMRKSSALPADNIKDLSSLSSEVVVGPTQAEQSLFNRVLKNGESKPFLRKGNGLRASSGAATAKMKASVATLASQNMKIEEGSDDSENQFEDSVDIIEGEVEEDEEEEVEDDDSEAVMVEESELKVVDYADSEKPVINTESIHYGDLELETKELLRSLGSMNPNSAVPSMVLDSPGESPASWNSRGHHPFSYTHHETSDIDGFAESPMGSPASWNSHSLSQIEVDAARMRKKWGSAQKTILLSNTSNHQTRKDVTKGFKRLLKFGRKSRGTESLADWISATTSEGDDDTEDGSDLANRSSEDLRKTRMGFSQDGFNDGDLFNEQVQALRSSIPTPPGNFKLREDHLSGSSLKAPRSFFSLSSFRSKGSESKPR
ncbi:hypothetical protein ACHQM5_029392 [Ranunculus cassubicifolius]